MLQLQTRDSQYFAWDANHCCIWGCSNWRRRMPWSTPRRWLSTWRILTVILKHLHLAWGAKLLGCLPLFLQSCHQAILAVTLLGAVVLQQVVLQWPFHRRSTRWQQATSRLHQTSSMPLKFGTKLNSFPKNKKNSLLNWTKWWALSSLMQASWQIWLVTPGRDCTGFGRMPSWYLELNIFSLPLIFSTTLCHITKENCHNTPPSRH